MLKEWIEWGWGVGTLVRLVSEVQVHFQSVGKPLMEEEAVSTIYLGCCGEDRF